MFMRIMRLCVTHHTFWDEIAHRSDHLLQVGADHQWLMSITGAAARSEGSFHRLIGMNDDLAQRCHRVEPPHSAQPLKISGRPVKPSSISALGIRTPGL